MTQLSPDEIEALVVAVAEETATQIKQEIHDNCPLGNREDKRQHDEDHVDLRRVLAIFKRFDNMQWKILGTVLSTIIAAAIIGVVGIMWALGVNDR